MLLILDLLDLGLALFLLLGLRVFGVRLLGLANAKTEDMNGLRIDARTHQPLTLGIKAHRVDIRVIATSPQLLDLLDGAFGYLVYPDYRSLRGGRRQDRTRDIKFYVVYDRVVDAESCALLDIVEDDLDLANMGAEGDDDVPSAFDVHLAQALRVEAGIESVNRVQLRKGIQVDVIFKYDDDSTESLGMREGTAARVVPGLPISFQLNCANLAFEYQLPDRLREIIVP